MAVGEWLGEGVSSEFKWSAGGAYASFVGRWSRLIAAEFVPWLGVPDGETWFDIGCGTGELTKAILNLAQPAKVLSLDPSSGYLEQARATVADRRVEFLRGNDQDVSSLGVTAGAAVFGLVLNFVPDTIGALSVAAAATKSGGVIGAYVWDYAEGMAMLRAFWDAAVEESANARPKDEGVRFPICRQEALRSAFESAELADVATRPIEVTDCYADFDEYWTPFLSGEAPAPGYLASLPSGRQARIKELVRQRLPVAADGSITLTCRAWAARSRRP